MLLRITLEEATSRGRRRVPDQLVNPQGSAALVWAVPGPLDHRFVVRSLSTPVLSIYGMLGIDCVNGLNIKLNICLLIALV